uniref:NADH-ubiquinone oxidoreductase chain 4L n=1 Tax=Callanthias japonicus TaxID=270594 RepID=A0A1V1FW73_9TELE|nr:NADH dehydrogenase subunit 4L [Callanthias japonicus]BBU25860.1 NADH dehydrogenase subunit 4L [Callanthias japonicus]
MSPLCFIFSSAFVTALLGLTMNRKHLLSALICLEGMMLSLFMALTSWTFQLGAMNFSTAPMLLLAFSACEAGVGLALLVAAVRTHGSDELHNLNLLRC